MCQKWRIGPWMVLADDVHRLTSLPPREQMALVDYRAGLVLVTKVE